LQYPGSRDSKPEVLNWRQFATPVFRDDLALCGDIFGFDTYWAEARNAANHSLMHSTGPATKVYLDHNVSNVEFEKSCSKLIIL
jgi:hypothetical protein